MYHYRSAAPSLFSSAAASGCQEWDPEAVLELTNPLKGCVTCVGYAPSRGRRCQNRIAAASVDCALGIVNTLARKNAYEAAASPQLESAATLLLCRQFHRSQAGDVVKGWRSKLEYLAARNEDSNSSSRASDTKSNMGFSEHSKREDSDGDGDNHYDNNKNADKQHLPEELPKLLQNLIDAIDRIIADLERLDKEWEVEAKVEAERRRRAQAARWRREEEERKEEARRQRQERRRREEEAAEAAFTRAFRERVRLARERMEREQEEKAEREAAEWRAAWERYTRGWEGGGPTTACIPWPVKSGLRRDVTEANVRLFFAEAPPADRRASAKGRLDLLNQELLRWHTDNGSIKGTLDSVARVLVELRRDARRACKA